MNFLLNRSLKQLGLFAVLVMLLVFIVQFIIIRSTIDNVHEAERKIDFARTTQIATVEIAFETQAYLNGKTELAPKIIASVTQQNLRLKTLGEGGRTAGADSFVKPLSRLAHITYSSLLESWLNYKESTSLLLTEKEIIEE